MQNGVLQYLKTVTGHGTNTFSLPLRHPQECVCPFPLPSCFSCLAAVFLPRCLFCFALLLFCLPGLGSCALSPPSSFPPLFLHLSCLLVVCSPCLFSAFVVLLSFSHRFVVAGCPCSLPPSLLRLVCVKPVITYGFNQQGRDGLLRLNKCIARYVAHWLHFSTLCMTMEYTNTSISSCVFESLDGFYDLFCHVVL